MMTWGRASAAILGLAASKMSPWTWPPSANTGSVGCWPRPYDSRLWACCSVMASCSNCLSHKDANCSVLLVQHCECERGGESPVHSYRMLKCLCLRASQQMAGSLSKCHKKLCLVPLSSSCDSVVFLCVWFHGVFIASAG